MWRPDFPKILSRRDISGRSILFTFNVVVQAPKFIEKNSPCFCVSTLGADVNAVCRDASMMSMRSVIPKLSQEEIKNLKAEDLGKCFSCIFFNHI